MKRLASVLLRGTLGLLGMSVAHGQDPLTELTQRVILTEPGPTQPVSDSPAINTVITSEELWRAGVRSIAQALRHIAGFYGIQDHLGENIGVRGLNPGPRAYSRILKVMVDGQPVAFRPDGTTALGPELIPLEAVDHVEVSRGPASALYGADAYLGAVNIVTRGYSRGSHGSLMARTLGSRGWGAEALVEAGGARWALLASAAHHALDRSGLPLPASSPILTYEPGVPRRSERDVAAPTSLFAKAESRLGDGFRTELTLHLSRLSSGAEWADIAPLSHRNEVKVRQGFLRLLTEWSDRSPWSFRSHITRAEGRPESGERLATPDPDIQVRRDFGTRSLDLGFAARRTFNLQDSFTVGFDHTRDDHQLLRVLRMQAGSPDPQPLGLDQGTLRFINSGLYAQVRSRLSESWNLDLNLRRDWHGRYGSTASHRISLLYRINAAFYAKALQGRSFKAPSPYQLYAAPLYPAEIRGNSQLTPETAGTSELEFGWEATNGIQARVRGFHIHAQGMIALAPRGTPTPVNEGQHTATGLEAEGKVLRGRHQWQAALSFQRGQGQEPRPFQGMVTLPLNLYPQRHASLQWTFRAEGGLSSVLEVLAAGPRRASSGNIAANQDRPYTLPGYAVLNGAVLFGWGPWSLNLRIDDLFNRQWTEPGFRGVDVPSLGRTVQVSAVWRY